MPAVRGPSRVHTRARYVRTNADLLRNDTSLLPPVSWWGLDSGAGTHPIGPNGPHVTGESLSVVNRATSLIVDPLVQVPWRVLTDGQAGTPAPAPRWITDPMLVRPDDRIGPQLTPAALRLPRALFWSQVLRAALWYGHGPFIFATDPAGLPIAGTFRALHPFDVDPVDTADGKVWRITGDGQHVDTDRSGRLVLGPVTYQLLVLRNPASQVTDGRSQGVFDMSPHVFGLAGQLERYTAGTFRSGIPAGYLKVTGQNLTQEQASELKAKWLSAHGGDRRSIAVLNASTEFTPVNLSPVDTKLVEVKRLVIADVAMAFGLDPFMLGASTESGMTYSNVESRWLHYRVSSLGVWITALQELLSSLLPGTAGVEVDTRQLTKADTASRYAAYQQGLAGGWLTLDEVRQAEGLPPLPEAIDTADQQRALSQQEAVQKVYLGVTNGVITVTEARQMINDAGGNLDLDVIPTPPQPATGGSDQP